MSDIQEKWKFLAGLTYAGQYFIIEIKPVKRPISGEFYFESRTKEVTLDELKKAQSEAEPQYISAL
jgi:hypothetical protein